MSLSARTRERERARTKSVLDECKRRSDKDIERMRKAALEQFGSAKGFLIGVNGSYARREATKGSDVDLFFLVMDDEDSAVNQHQSRFRQFLKTELKMKLPARRSVFEKPLAVKQIYKIGGLNDDNETLTRRMLLLLEGEWVFNERAFHQVRKTLLEKYLYYELGKDKICLFLLNDIIRYWRTICIDLEHKTHDNGKSRGIRLIKLRFSRMLLYVSGVLTIGEGHGLSSEDKMESLLLLFGEHPIERIQSVVGDKAESILELYAKFLQALNTPEIREALREAGETQAFKDMSAMAGDFRRGLHDLFEEHFGDDNPTIRALLL